jgi:hypothetical protein
MIMVKISWWWRGQGKQGDKEEFSFQPTTDDHTLLQTALFPKLDLCRPSRANPRKFLTIKE